ncbi:MAG: hypothetical protein EBZ56_05420 [Burkholderiaceae bacterium]|nr:hypothetical protein [Burkholderiaceae bacterium]
MPWTIRAAWKASIAGTGRDGRVTKGDVQNAIAGGAKHVASAAPLPMSNMPLGDRTEERVPMTRLRARIAERLLESQANNAILTTFNEVNMAPVIAMRSRYKDVFEKTHGVKLGFMSFFVKAATYALKRYPILNGNGFARFFLPLQERCFGNRFRKLWNLYVK